MGKAVVYGCLGAAILGPQEFSVQLFKMLQVQLSAGAEPPYSPSFLTFANG
jgi:hypothetical protein